MTLEQMHHVIAERIPTPAEFVAFAGAQGWKIAVRPDGKPCLRVPDRNDPLAVALARMLGREPYRTEVMALVLPPAQVPAHAPDTPSDAPPLATPREWRWRFDHRYVETPDDPMFGRAEHHPTGAQWWRWVGETDERWRPVPGRPMSERVRLPQEGERSA